MLPLHQTDILEVVRVLLPMPRAAREGAMAGFIAMAEAADSYRRKTGRLHRIWGDGSLAAVVARLPRGRARGFDDPDYAGCWMLVLDAVIRHRAGAARPRSQETGAAAAGPCSNRGL